MTAAVRFRQFAAATTAMTFGLILLGVYTAATGAGLSCSAQWPLCDGGLLPQSIPSFIEWFHRLVAMITGFAILGTTAWAWKAHGDDPRIKWSATLALVVLPVQVLLGGATVIRYTPAVQTAHHGAALVIFAALLATTLWAYEEATNAGSATESASGTPADD